MAEVGEPNKRYYTVKVPGNGDGKTFALVEGIPDPEKPDNADKDTKDGSEMVRAGEGAFWPAVKEAGFCWVQRDFRRYWVWDPALAAGANSL